MVILWCRQTCGADSLWRTCGRFERRCSPGRSHSLLTLLTRRDPSGDDAVGLTWPLFCRCNPSPEDVAARRIISLEEDPDPLEAPRMAGPATVDSDVNLMVADLIRLAEGGALKRTGRTTRRLVRRASADRGAKGRLG
jgi:hypothetical protein